MLLKIEKMAQGGRGLARLADGRICFVEGALPGETVTVELLHNKKDFAEARAVQIEEAHPMRVNPSCPHYGVCGGCNLQHAASALQADMHRAVVDELFVRFARCSLPSGWTIHSGKQWNYRNRARFVRSENGWGFRSRSSRNTVTLTDCPVLSAGLNDFLNHAPRNLHSREADVFDNGSGRVVYWHEGLRDKRLCRAEVPLLDKTVSMDASVFFQSNLGLLPDLVNAVLQAAGTGRHVVDLFSGVGLFSLFLQDRFDKVSAVERDRGCLFHAGVHLGDNCQFVVEPAEEWLAVQGRLNGVDCVVVDPPRTGLPLGICEAIVTSRTRRLVYVSCDPVTLARDARILIRQGYTLTSAQGFAFYPHTSHFEMLAVFDAGTQA